MVASSRKSKASVVQKKLGRNIETSREVMETINKSPAGEKQGYELLPGIPDAITFDHITTRLPWITFHVLSSVSHGWRHAILSHQVLEARARAQTTETLVVVNISLPDYVKAIVLYSVRYKCFWRVPPIPQWEEFPTDAQCVSLDVKLYVLRGIKKQCPYPSTDLLADLGGHEVYMLDLTGQRQWRQCASMLDARHQFGCGVIDGKIYVFGGTSMYHSVSGSEVYDPKMDVWSPISPMRNLGCKHRVTAVGGELVVHGGEFYEPDYTGWWAPSDPNTPLRQLSLSCGLTVGAVVVDFDGAHQLHPLHENFEEAFSLEAYDPIKDEWRVVETEHIREASSLEVYNPLIDSKVVGTERIEMLCSITWHGVEVHDMSDGGSWTHVHSFMSDQILPTGSNPCELFATVVVDGELLAILHWFDVDDSFYKSCVVQSRGFCSGNREIVWQKAQWSCPLSFYHELRHVSYSALRTYVGSNFSAFLI